MNLQIFAVRDTATDQFANPIFLINKAHALRQFGDEVNRQEEQNPLNKHPEHFELYHIGEYDTNTALFKTHAPKSVATAAELIEHK